MCACVVCVCVCVCVCGDIQSGCGLLGDHAHSIILCCYMSTEVNVVIHVSEQLSTDMGRGLAEVSYELSL